MGKECRKGNIYDIFTLCILLTLPQYSRNRSVDFQALALDYSRAAQLCAAEGPSKANERRFRQLYHLEDLGMWTKLRPGVVKFLEHLSYYFEMHLYTLGNERYANAMAVLLDPDGTLFKKRIIGRSDAEEKTGVLSPDSLISDWRTKDFSNDLIEGDERIALIVDDTNKVWPDHAQNLLTVERYFFFPSSRKSYGLKGMSYLEVEF